VCPFFLTKTRDQWASFEYDALNRLVHADYPKNDDIDYEWDAVGNLIEKSTHSRSYGYEYNRASQLTAFDGHRLPGFGCDYDGACDDDSDDADGQWFSYQYDDNGYLTAIDSNQGTQTYAHDPLGRMLEVNNPNGSYVHYRYDSRARRITTERNRITDDGIQAPQRLTTQYDGRQAQAQFEAGKAFRSLTLLPEQNGYATVLHQALHNTDSPYLKASSDKGADISNLYLHQDRQGSTILALDSGNTQAMRLGYSPFGEVFRKHNDQTFWKANSTVSANHQLGQLVPYKLFLERMGQVHRRQHRTRADGRTLVQSSHAPFPAAGLLESKKYALNGCKKCRAELTAPHQQS
jgi:YD repeat-containing protein